MRDMAERAADLERRVTAVEGKLLGTDGRVRRELSVQKARRLVMQSRQLRQDAGMPELDMSERW